MNRLAKRMRLDKMLAHLGFGTRSQLKKLVREGVVMVNGEVVTDSSIHVDPEEDVIQVWEEEVKYIQHLYLMLNKPAGYISATYDPVDSTVLDLVPKEYAHFNLFPVGRLDKDAVGLLLLTNDGKLAHRLTSPRHHVPKRYFVRVEGRVTEREARKFAEGFRLDGEEDITLPAQLVILSQGDVSEAEVTITEGKYHQIKRMFQACGMKVLYLKRISMGPLRLDPHLEEGEIRPLTEDEMNDLREAASGG